MDQKNRKFYLDEFLKKCREAGLNVTPQRIVIYKSMINDDSHPSPENIYKQIHHEHPTISLATVYKTLETFAKYGIITRLTSLYNTLRYDRLTKRHHHVICVSCKKVIDLSDAELDSIPIPKSVYLENELIDFSVHFNVVCSECKSQ